MIIVFFSLFLYFTTLFSYFFIFFFTVYHIFLYFGELPFFLLLSMIKNLFIVIVRVAMIVCCAAQHAPQHSTVQHPCPLQYNTTQV